MIERGKPVIGTTGPDMNATGQTGFRIKRSGADA